MNITLTLAIIFAVLAPITYAFVNVFDKFIISKRTKSSLGYTALAGIAVLSWGIILSLFLDWSYVNLISIWPVAISGIVFGLQYFLYYKILEKGDASNFIGLIYLYPVITVILSFIFLKEVLPIIAYFGILISIAGATILSIRIRKIHGKSVLFLIGIAIISIAIYEFLIKFAVNNLPEWNAIALESIFIGLAICSCLISKKTRKLAFSEIKNFKLAAFSEFFTLASVAFTFFAMTRLSPTVIATICTIQPFVVMFFERTLSKFFGKIHKDKITFWRIVSILLTILGVVIITITTN